MLCNNYKNNGSVLINRILLISEDKITSVKIHSYRFLNYKIDSHDNIEEKKRAATFWLQLFNYFAEILCLFKFQCFCWLVANLSRTKILDGARVNIIGFYSPLSPF